jgi:hypothetical protein
MSAFRDEAEKLLYKYVTSFQAVSYEELADELEVLHKREVERIIDEPSDVVKKGDTAFTAIDKLRAEQRAKLNTEEK